MPLQLKNIKEIIIFEDKRGINREVSDLLSHSSVASDDYMNFHNSHDNFMGSDFLDETAMDPPLVFEKCSHTRPDPYPEIWLAVSELKKLVSEEPDLKPLKDMKIKL